MSDPLIDVRWRRIGSWAGDEGSDNECCGLSLRTFIARLSRATKRGNIVQIISVKLSPNGSIDPIRTTMPVGRNRSVRR